MTLTVFILYEKMQQALLPVMNLFAVGPDQFTFEQFDFFKCYPLRHPEFILVCAVPGAM